MLVVPRSSVALLRLSVVACVSSVCAKSDGSRIFGIPRSQVCRTGRAKLNLSMRKNPHENAFSLLDTLVKRVKTDRRPKNFIFSMPFSLLKQPFFARPRVQQPTRKPFFAYIHEKEQNRLFEKRPYYPPPPPPPAKSNFVGGSGVSMSKPQKILGSVMVGGVTVLLLLLLLLLLGTGHSVGFNDVCERECGYSLNLS